MNQFITNTLSILVIVGIVCCVSVTSASTLNSAHSANLLSDNTDTTKYLAIDTSGASKNKIFTLVEEAPQFPGGEAELYKYLKENINFKNKDNCNDADGRIIISFVVRNNGRIKDVEVKRSLCPAIDKEAVRVISRMPKWKPGKQQGKYVHCRYIVPVVVRWQ